MQKRTLAVALAAFWVFMVMAFAAGYGVAVWVNGVSAIPTGHSDLKLYRQSWNLLNQEFIGPMPSRQEQVYSSIEGLTKAFDDPYTRFLRPQSSRMEQEDLQGKFGGIGAWLEMRSDGSIILRPMPGNPADRSGIKAGDVLVKVDNHIVPEHPDIQQVVSWVRGKPGTQVKITVRRAPGEVITFTITRAEIRHFTVSWRVLDKEAGIGYVSLDLFGERSDEELRKAIEDLRRQGASRLVLDLRQNPGGLLSSVEEVAGEFLPAGKVLLYEKHRDEEIAHRVRGKGVAVDMPMVVLVDSGTASAAEILAGALQDYGRAKLVGGKTFGKGSVQDIHAFDDGSSIHITIAKWLTPRKRAIDGRGIEPDLHVEPEAGEDAPLEKAVEMLKGEDGSK